MNEFCNLCISGASIKSVLERGASIWDHADGHVPIYNANADALVERHGHAAMLKDKIEVCKAGANAPFRWCHPIMKGRLA